MPGIWTEEAIAGKPAAVFTPAAGPRFGLLFLHGIGQETLAGNDAFTRRLDQHGLACVCPSGKLSWWTDRPCPDFDPMLTAEQYLLRHVIPIFHERWKLPPRSLGVFGISMGGQGALRLAFRHPGVFPAVAALSSAIDYHELYGQGPPLDDMYDSKEQCRQDTATLHVNPLRYPPHIYFCIDPDDQPWHRGNDRLHEKLSALGIAHTADLNTQAGAHSWEYFNSMAEPAIRFLLDGLEKESRKLL